MVIGIEVVALIAVLALLFAVVMPLHGYSFLAAAAIAFLGGLFATWQSLLEPAHTLDLYTWLAGGTGQWTFSVALEAQRIALLSLFNSVALLLAIYALGFKGEIARRDFSIAALALLSLQVAGLAASAIAFLFAWSLLGFAALWCGVERDGWDGVRPLDRLGDILFVVGVLLSQADVPHIAAYCLLLAIWTRMGHLPFPLELFRADSGRCRGWLFALLGDLVSPFVALALFLHYRALIAAQIGVLDIGLYVGLATALAAVLAALKVSDVRRSLSLTTAGQMGLVLAFMGMGAEVAAIFLLALHGVAKALARVAVDGMALAAGGMWRRQDLGLLRRQLPLFSAAFHLASLLLALGPGFAVLWMWDGQGEQWILAVWSALALLFSLQIGSVAVRVFSLPTPEQKHAFPAPQQAASAALIGLAALAIAVAAALPHSPLNWLRPAGGAGLLAPMAFLPLAASICGQFLSWIVFRAVEKGRPLQPRGSWEQWLAEGYYLRDLYALWAPRPLLAGVYWLRAVNMALFEMALNKGGGLVFRGLGWVLARVHDGRVRCYGAIALGGVVALLWGMVKE